MVRSGKPLLASITGTPGTGKTRAAKIAAKMTRANLVSQNEIVDMMKTAIDKKRGARIADEKKIKKEAESMLSKGVNIIEGHLSHYANPDIVIVLRCRPDVLEKRLEKKRWSRTKILENVQAETLDTATIEALEECGKDRVCELDTTKKTAENTGKLIAKILYSVKERKRYKAGKIDWSEKWKKYLVDRRV